MGRVIALLLLSKVSKTKKRKRKVWEREEGKKRGKDIFLAFQTPREQAFL